MYIMCKKNHARGKGSEVQVPQLRSGNPLAMREMQALWTKLQVPSMWTLGTLILHI